MFGFQFHICYCLVKYIRYLNFTCLMVISSILSSRLGFSFDEKHILFLYWMEIFSFHFSLIRLLPGVIVFILSAINTLLSSYLILKNSSTDDKSGLKIGITLRDSCLECLKHFLIWKTDRRDQDRNFLLSNLYQR